jgi:hypothetical protein
MEFIQLLDPKINPLPENMASALHAIALSCIQEKKRRPLMTQVYNYKVLTMMSYKINDFIG